MIYVKKELKIAVMDYYAECQKCGTSMCDNDDLNCAVCDDWFCPKDGCCGEVFTSEKGDKFYICSSCIESKNKFLVVNLK